MDACATTYEMHIFNTKIYAGKWIALVNDKNTHNMHTHFTFAKSYVNNNMVINVCVPVCVCVCRCRSAAELETSKKEPN